MKTVKGLFTLHKKKTFTEDLVATSSSKNVDMTVGVCLVFFSCNSTTQDIFKTVH